jgi:hypothetical protein
MRTSSSSNPSRARNLVRLDPRLQPGSVETAGGDVKDRLFGLVHGRLDAPAVEPKERDQGSVPDPLVAIYEWMVLDQGESQRRGLGRQARVEVRAAERLSRLRDRRFQCAKITKQRLLATLFHDEAMEEQYLSQAEVAHYRKRP